MTDRRATLLRMVAAFHGVMGWGDDVGWPTTEIEQEIAGRVFHYSVRSQTVALHFNPRGMVDYPLSDHFRHTLWTDRWRAWALDHRFDPARSDAKCFAFRGHRKVFEQDAILLLLAKPA